jgi:hypothetical protein
MSAIPAHGPAAEARAPLPASIAPATAARIGGRPAAGAGECRCQPANFTLLRPRLTCRLSPLLLLQCQAVPDDDCIEISSADGSFTSFQELSLAERLGISSMLSPKATLASSDAADAPRQPQRPPPSDGDGAESNDVASTLLSPTWGTLHMDGVVMCKGPHVQKLFTKSDFTARSRPQRALRVSLR